jgi:hypothetical protein
VSYFKLLTILFFNWDSTFNYVHSTLFTYQHESENSQIPCNYDTDNRTLLQFQKLIYLITVLNSNFITAFGRKSFIYCRKSRISSFVPKTVCLHFYIKRSAATTYITIIIIISHLSQGVCSLVCLWSQRCTSPLMLQISDCSTFLIICDAPRIAVFCREPMELFPVAPMTTGMTKHFIFHIR